MNTKYLDKMDSQESQHAAENLINRPAEMSQRVVFGETKKLTSPNLYKLFKPKFLLHSTEAWEEDRAQRFNIPKLNATFFKSVPVLEKLQWEITSIERGYAETRLPLNTVSSNQYMTTQAALQLVAADYTGGIALATLFHQKPIIGFMPVTHDNEGVYLWGARSEIQWHKPSCGDLICKARIPHEDWEKFARRVNRHQAIAPKVKIELFNGADLVGEVIFTYFAQDVISLRRNAFDPQKIHFLYLHKTRATAKLIAGLRALEWHKPPAERLCEDPCAALLAGKHGVTLAQRFQLIIPELQEMVAARTKHLDETVLNFLRKHPMANVVNVGAGYDARFWRLDISSDVNIYELDLPVMLEERKKIFEYELKPNIHLLPIDLRDTTVLQAVESDSSFNGALPTLVIWEGGSMYFDKPDARNIFNSLSEIAEKCEHSMVWIDYVTEDVIDNTTGIKEVETFIQSMQEMGEPFVCGISKIQEYAREHGLTVVDEVSCAAYLHSDHNVMQHYKFCTLSAAKEAI